MPINDRMDRCSTTFTFWRQRGLSVRAANILGNLHCESLDDVRRLGIREVLRQHGMGPPTFNEIANLIGWPELTVTRGRRALEQADDVLSANDMATVVAMIEQRRA